MASGVCGTRSLLEVNIVSLIIGLDYDSAQFATNCFKQTMSDTVYSGVVFVLLPLSIVFV